MRKELVFVLLALFLCAGCNGNKKKMNGEHDLDAANITLDRWMTIRLVFIIIGMEIRQWMEK
ncbi:hypothetical protein [Bacteroides thetaiotaomicron]|uniref:hypothetical protein n=1 Tax=Bacteroides thetaiotaomicron TaxID=818 RepID=UPI001F5E0DB1|nr:hypothetical protein [Bacteroides thetaiotaomicron]